MLYKFLQWCPGAVGLLLRQKLYPRYLKNCGRKVLFGRFVEFVNAREKITIGSGVVLNDFVCLDGGDPSDFDSPLIIEDNVFIGTGTTVKVTDGSIRIGAGTNIGSDCLVQSDLPVVFENDVLVAAFCEIGKRDHGRQQLPDHVDSDSSTLSTETTVKEGGWIGVRGKIKAGHHIGEGTIIGAHSNVVTDLADKVVAIGDPAQVLRERKEPQVIGRKS